MGRFSSSSFPPSSFISRSRVTEWRSERQVGEDEDQRSSRHTSLSACMTRTAPRRAQGTEMFKNCHHSAKCVPRRDASRTARLLAGAPR